MLFRKTSLTNPEALNSQQVEAGLTISIPNSCSVPFSRWMERTMPHCFGLQIKDTWSPTLNVWILYSKSVLIRRAFPRRHLFKVWPRKLPFVPCLWRSSCSKNLQKINYFLCMLPYKEKIGFLWDFITVFELHFQKDKILAQLIHVEFTRCVIIQLTKTIIARLPSNMTWCRPVHFTVPHFSESLSVLSTKTARASTGRSSTFSSINTDRLASPLCFSEEKKENLAAGVKKSYELVYEHACVCAWVSSLGLFTISLGVDGPFIL